MSRKHNTKHPERGTSNYPQRLARRAGAQTMEDLRTLRKRQLRSVLLLSGEELDARVNEGLTAY